MLDAYQVVSRIRRALASQLVLQQHEFESIADDFTTLCHYANQRLVACEAFLRQGNRSEAVRLSEISPKLLVLVNELNFPDRQAWDTYVMQMGFAPPPILMLETAFELNAAYETEQQLAPLVTRWRRLNLERAPLKDRVLALRALREADPCTACWDEDLRVLESAWTAELEKAANRHLSALDVDGYQQVYDEVMAFTWVNPPPSRLLKAMNGARVRLHEAHAKAQLKRFSRAFRKAHQRSDVQESRVLRDEWSRFVTAHPAIASDPLADSVQQALFWLSQIEQSGQFPTTGG